MAWKCKCCGEKLIRFAETKFYDVDKNRNISRDDLGRICSFTCLYCDCEGYNLEDIAKWEED